MSQIEEANELAEKLQILQTPIKEEEEENETELETEKKKKNQQQKKKKTAINKPRVVSSRCTRSQVAPDWTVHEMLILVNEISSVEGDCLKALPSYQKWKIIADNCNALDVIRSMNQCRRKWDSLLSEFKKIKEWEESHSEFGVVGSYWSLEIEKKKEFGLPDCFERELFETIDELVKSRENQSDTDPDSDPEAADVLDVIMDSGSKKKKRKRGHQKVNVAEQEIAVKLQENAELIHAILRGDLTGDTDNKLTDMRNYGVLQNEFTRRQGDELINVLGSLVGTLNQLSDLVEESR